MTYSRLLDDSDYNPDLVRRRRELDELRAYPAGERVFTGASRIMMALLLGGSNVVTLVLLGTALSMPVSIGFLAGAVVYAIRAARDVYKKRKRELELTNLLIANQNRLQFLFDQAFLDELAELLLLSRDGFLNEERSESVYTQLYELKKVFDTELPDPTQNNRYIDAISRSLDKLTPRIRAFRELPVAEPCLPDMDVGIIPFPRYEKKVKSFSIPRYGKKFGNRLLSFLAGTSSAVGIALGIASIAFGITAPVGLTLLAIVGASAIVGMTAVVIDYHLSRRQDKKILQLDYKNRELEVLQLGVNNVKNNFGRIKQNVHQSIIHQRKEAEAEQLKNALLLQTQQNQATIAALEKSLDSERQRVRALRDEVNDLRGREVIYLPPGTLFRNEAKVVLPPRQAQSKRPRKPKKTRHLASDLQTLLPSSDQPPRPPSPASAI